MLAAVTKAATPVTASSIHFDQPPYMIMSRMGPARRRREAMKRPKKASSWICSGVMLSLGAILGGVGY